MAVYITNSAIVPNDGIYLCRKIPPRIFALEVEEAARSGGFISHVGYAQTARHIQKLTGYKIDVNRGQTMLMHGDVILVAKLRFRFKDVKAKQEHQPNRRYTYQRITYYRVNDPRLDRRLNDNSRGWDKHTVGEIVELGWVEEG